MRIKNTQDFVAKATAKHKGFYTYAGSVYTGSNAKVTITCPVHGDFEQLASDHANTGKGCKACGNRRGAPAAFTLADFIRLAKARHGDRYDYAAAVYTTYKKRLIIRCPLHGSFEQIAGKHLKGHGCPTCRDGKAQARNSSASLEQRCAAWKKGAAAQHNGVYDYAEAEFTSSKTPVKILCPDHGAFYQSPDNHLNNTTACPQCSRTSKSKKLQKTPQEWLQIFRAVHGERYDYPFPDTLQGCTEWITVQCKEHGDFTQRVDVHSQGGNCSRCGTRISAAEDTLTAWLQELLPKVNMIMNSRQIIKPQELDIYIPSKSLAIEFNGTHWHSDTYKPRLYHQEKSLRCQEKGIQLIHIYEYDWVMRTEACKRLLRGKLGTTVRLHARKLQIRECDACRDFLAANHFQGYVAATVSYGLYEGESLRALMTFGPSRFGGGYDWELLRYCVADGFRIAGGASRLFQSFTRQHLKPGQILVSYARMDYSQGAVYQKLGFTLEAICPPDYSWVLQPYKILKRYATQKHRLKTLLGKKFDPLKTETENMKGAHYKKIYSAGNLRYTYRHGT